MTLMVGCPLTARNWILPLWKNTVLTAAEHAGQSVEFVFVVPEADSETRDLLATWQEPVSVSVTTEPLRKDQRVWNMERFEHMVILRNSLLENVRERSPEHFLSLDSDILLSPQSISSAFEVMKDYDADAVGLKAHLAPTGKEFPNLGFWTSPRRDKFHRSDYTRVTRVDVLLAAKLMTPQAYNIDYAAHQYGEDAGWSLNAAKAGLKFFWDGTVTNKHVMSEKMLGVIDRRVGW